MLEILKDKTVNDLNEYGYTYGRKIISSLKETAFIDSEYIESMVKELDSFAPVIRLQGINDSITLNVDVKVGMQLRDDYDSFGDFCYETLYECFKASNECLRLNNKLAHDLHELFQFEYVDIAVASNYVAFNSFSNKGRIALTNFRKINGIGQFYDIEFDAKRLSTIRTNNVQESIKSELVYLTELAQITNELTNKNSELNELLYDWSNIVNDKLFDIKNAGILAWTSLLNTYKDSWGEFQFTKQTRDIYCTLLFKKTGMFETLHRYGVTNKVDWGDNYTIVPLLDYINIMNVKFE